MEHQGCKSGLPNAWVESNSWASVLVIKLFLLDMKTESLHTARGLVMFQRTLLWMTSTVRVLKNLFGVAGILGITTVVPMKEQVSCVQVELKVFHNILS